MVKKDEVREEEEALQEDSERRRPREHKTYYHDKGGMLTKQVTVGTMLLWLLCIVLLVGIFMMGRYVYPICDGVSTTKTTDTLTSAATVDNDSDDADDTTATDTDDTADTDADDTAATGTGDHSSDSVITEYSKVKIEFDTSKANNGIEVDTSKGYGRVTKIYYKITNLEKGTIKPTEITYHLDGNPQAKTSELPTFMQTIYKGKIIRWQLTPSGGASSLDTYGSDVNELKYTIKLYDSNDTLMSSASKTFTV